MRTILMKVMKGVLLVFVGLAILSFSMNLAVWSVWLVQR